MAAPQMTSTPKPIFRSILPHEPIPQDERFGYLLVQGSFEPKQIKKKQTQSTGTGERVQKAAQSSDRNFWMDAESLESALMEAPIISNTNGLMKIQVLDNDPPFTKIRIYFTSPVLATMAMKSWKYFDNSKGLSPHHLLIHSKNPAHYLQQHKQHDDLENQQIFNLQSFSQKPLQITQLSTTKLLSSTKHQNSDNEDSAPIWPRSNPPKFRRLLHANSSAEDRSKTRYVFMTNLFPKHTDTLQNLSRQKTTRTDESLIVTETEIVDVDAMAQAIRDCIGSQLTHKIDLSLPIEVFMSKPKSTSASNLPQSCHIGMRFSEDAQILVQSLMGKTVDWDIPVITTTTTTTSTVSGDSKIMSISTASSIVTVSSGSLFLDYADLTQRSLARSCPSTTTITPGMPSQSTCTSTTASVHVPGLILVENYISQQEHDMLMATLLGPHAPWAPQQTTKNQKGHLKRRVQHYGHVFDYKTAHVLLRPEHQTCDGLMPINQHDNDTAAAAHCPPLPAIPAHFHHEDDGKSNIESKNKLQRLETYISQCIDNGDGWGVLAGILERTRNYKFQEQQSTRIAHNQYLEFPNINQMTVNEYKPGEGIGSHVDTIEAFDDGLMSLSLNSGVVMEFTKVFEHNKGDSNDAMPLKKLVYLPPRSLLVMTGDARYKWEHMIVTRMTDTHEGVVLKRDTRVSLTLRTALKLPPTGDERKFMRQDPLPRVESSVFPPKWGTTIANQYVCDSEGQSTEDSPDNDTKMQNNNETVAKLTPEMERQHVHHVYDAIAAQWHHTRGKRGVLWPGATQFLLETVPPGSIIADIGCGDGKYFPAIWANGSYVLGTDICRPLLLLQTNQNEPLSSKPKKTQDNNQRDATRPSIPDCRQVSPERKYLQRFPAVAVADCMSTPLRSQSCDAAICVAVMHHLSTLERRLQCIRELVRIVKPGGLINIQAWALDQEHTSKRKFVTTDVFVPFNAQPKYLTLDKKEASDNKICIQQENPGTVPKAEENHPVQKKDNSTSTTNQPDDGKVKGREKKKSVAEMFANNFEGAQFDEDKGLVVFQRYCHLYRRGELEELASQVPNCALVESGFESGNYYIILQVLREKI